MFFVVSRNSSQARCGTSRHADPKVGADGAASALVAPAGAQPVTAPAASLGVGTRRPDSLYVNIRVRSHWTVILEPFRLVMDALRAPSSTLGEGNFTVPESKIGFDRHR